MMLLLLASIAHAAAQEPLGVVRCKDVPIRVEIIDTVPRLLRWNRSYRVTHYIRNFGGTPITLYFLARRVEFKWEDTGIGTEESIAPQNAEPGSGPYVHLYSGQSFVSSVEGSFGNRGADGRIEDKSAFHFAFTNAMLHRVPRAIQIRFVYGFALDPSGSTDSQHSVATGWKTLHILAPNKALQRTAHGGRRFSVSHVHLAMSRR